MKILLRSFLMLLLPVLAGVGCTVETDLGPAPGAGETKLTFRVELPSHTRPETKGTAGTTDENAVTDIHVLAFDKNDNFAYVKKVTSFTNVSGTNNNQRTFTVSLVTSADAADTYSFVLIANAQGETLAQIAALTASTSKTAALGALTYSSSVAPLTHIPMSSVSTAAMQVTASTTIGGIQLIRMTARLDVTTALANYRIAEVNLYDYNTRGKVHSTKITANKATAVDLPGTPAKVKGPVAVTNAGSNLKNFESQLYTYEVLNSVNNPCLVVKLEYSADGSTGWTSHGYYKLPFKQNGTPVDIKRNTRYVFSIASVAGTGFPDKEQAYQSEPVGIGSEVIEWDDTELSGIVVSGSYFLAVGPTEFDLYKEAKAFGDNTTVKVASNLPLQAGINWTAKLYTDAAGTTEITGSDPWIKLENTTGGVLYTTGGKEKSTLRYSVAENTGTAPREAWIHLTGIGTNITFKVRVTQSNLVDPGSNPTPDPNKPAPPTAGVLAPANILAVDKDGILNLDGPAREDNYIVYFKWGSVIAISAGIGENGDYYDITDVAWIPKEYTNLSTLVSWEYIPYQSSGEQIVTNYFNGTGDPCKLAVKSNIIGNFRMPAGNPYERFYHQGDSQIAPGSNWKMNYLTHGDGLLDPSYGQFYPAAGYRQLTSGQLEARDYHVWYWSREARGDEGVALNLDAYPAIVNGPRYSGRVRSYGTPIRCVEEVAPAIPSLEITNMAASYTADGTTEHTFTVTSNVAWIAAATTNGTAVKSFDASGVANESGQAFKFVLNSTSVASTVTFTFTYGGQTKTQVINYTVPQGNGGGGKPGGSILAPHYILAVDANGVLNLDGPDRPNNYIVHFKFGSMIALSVKGNYDEFDRDDIAWTPEGFDYDALYTSMAGLTAGNAWKMINYADETNFAYTFPANDLENGRGDPCKIAIKGGVVGGHRLPTYNSYASGYFYTNLNVEIGSNWKESHDGYIAGLLDPTYGQYYPAAGLRDMNTGETMGIGGSGRYLTSSKSRETRWGGCYMSFGKGQYVYVNGSAIETGYGAPIRCIP